MPPVFGPASPSSSALEVLRGRRARARRARRRARTATPPRPRAAPRSRVVAEGRRRAERRVELVLGPADEDALAGGEPVRLDDARRPRRPPSPRPSGTPAAAHHLLGEALRALDPRRRGARPEDRDAATAQLVARRPRRAAPRARSRRGRSRAPARARAGLRRPRRAPDGRRRARRCPGCPAPRAARSSRGLCASFHASACSRPPEPTSSTFTRATLLASPAGLKAARRA